MCIEKIGPGLAARGRSASVESLDDEVAAADQNGDTDQDRNNQSRHVQSSSFFCAGTTKLKVKSCAYFRLELAANVGTETRLPQLRQIGRR